jgi:hypothetical protein
MLRNLLDAGLEDRIERVSVSFSYDTQTPFKQKQNKSASNSQKSTKLKFLGRLKPRGRLFYHTDFNQLIGRMAHVELLENTDFIQMFQCMYEWHL